MGGIAEKNNDEAERQPKAHLELLGAPFHLVANPSIGKDADYSPPQEKWLDRPAVTDRSHTPPPARGRATHAFSRMQRAADFAWTFACPLEEAQISILHLRNPYALTTLRPASTWVTRHNMLLAKDPAQTEAIAHQVAES